MPGVNGCWIRFAVVLCLGCASLSAQSPAARATGQPSFAHDVAPLISEKCLECHGATTMSDLDLRTSAGLAKGGKHGPVVVAGKPGESLLYRHLTGQLAPQMPLGSRLSDEQIGTFRQWIEAGAKWDPAITALNAPAPGGHKFTDAQRRYWAFQPVVKPAVPPAKNAWVKTPIDALVLAALDAKKIKPHPPADKITLIRRATLDLTGLPPSPEEVQAFLADDSPDAFARVVDRLLASPAYGERWGRHWLDLARYADSNGFKSDETRPNIWRYRDYVIQAFNEDKPYDRFIREQIAGDELYPGDMNARIATGFLRQYTEETNQPVLELRRQEILNDETDTTAAVFMGLTYGCAKCHDHKFDPILQTDYYRLQAFFADIRQDDNYVLLQGDQMAAYQKQLAEWREKTKSIRDEMHALVAPLGKEKADYYSIRFSAGTKAALNTPVEQRTPIQSVLAFLATPQITYQDADLAKELKGEQKERFAALAADLKRYEAERPHPPVAQTVIDNGAVAPKTFVLAGNSWDAPKQEVHPGFLTILDPVDPKITPLPALNSTGRRSVLANWLADPKNPLTARVMVNRIWHYHFGIGIVPSTSDFGLMGDRPSNQKLLDYLAATFVEQGWSIKKLHRMIMLSSVYQESSAADSASIAADPDNKLFWRYPRHRIEGEAIRDSMLYTSGLLNRDIGGPGVHPEVPPGTLTSGAKWPVDKDPQQANRRSVYVFVKRVMTYPMFEAFDAANNEESCPRRFRTVIPSQALVLMNDKLVLQWSEALASRILNDPGLSTDQEIERAYRLVLSRAPRTKEEQEVRGFLDSQAALIAQRLEKHEAVALPASLPSGEKPERVAAFADFCHALMNSNEFLYMN